MRRQPLSVRQVIPWLPAAAILSVMIVISSMMLAGGMQRVAGWYMLHLLPPALGLVVLIGTGVAVVVRRRLGRVAIVTAIAALAALLPALLLVVPVAYPASLEATTPSATVRLPADVPLKVGWGGDSYAVNYHVVVPDQRWAYDFLVAPYLTGSTRLADYGCYGVPVVAPIRGVVTAAHDGEPDMTPGTLSNNTTAPTGNYVVIRMATGTYLVIAHLKPGSIAVTAGQQVEEGQAIGQCGNSGNTSEPHIHIHHQRQDPAEYPLNFAEGLPLFFRDHNGPPMPEGGLAMENGKAVAVGATVQHIGQ